MVDMAWMVVMWLTWGGYMAWMDGGYGQEWFCSGHGDVMVKNGFVVVDGCEPMGGDEEPYGCVVRFRLRMAVKWWFHEGLCAVRHAVGLVDDG